MHVCWVCGHESISPSDMRDHFLACHDEGTHYLICPVCGRIVNDMVVHFQACHRGMPLPPGVPIKTEESPKDYRRFKAIEIKKTNKKRFKQGFFESVKNGRQLHYRSSWEQKVYRILEEAFSVKTYQAEPFPIDYAFKGNIQNYWPDILVNFIDNSRMLVEIKPLKQCPDKEGKQDDAEKAKNDAKWQAASAFCEAKGMKFVVWTERAIDHFARLRKDQLTKNELLGTNDKMDTSLDKKFDVGSDY